MPRHRPTPTLLFIKIYHSNAKLLKNKHRHNDGVSSANSSLADNRKEHLLI
ncbi:hypothetical protein JCM18903_1945 [Psychrobacter sp. JCM 18903]|nr:hypothetical protein JCM18903_1945 [Psychrobacter sp. JCM 18903]